MAHISVKDAQPGMVLAGDVVAPGERLLLRAGSALTEANLRTLQRFAVFDLDVEGVTREDIVARVADSLEPAKRDVIEARLDALFHRTDRSQPLMDELIHLARLRLIRQAHGASDGA